MELRLFPWDYGQCHDNVKILGVVMDAKLKYKEHIARAASKGLGVAMELSNSEICPIDGAAAVHIYGCPSGGLCL